MSHLVETMFSAREVPWHGLGTVVPNVLTAQEAIKAGGLDWDVELRPVYTNNLKGNRIRIPKAQAIVRDSDEKVLGVVGNKYVPFQNRDAFQFFDNLVDSGEAKYETAGSLKGGKLVWLTAKLPNHVSLGGVDDVEIYILLWTSHDGTKAITVDVTPIRVVCANTLNLAVERSKRRWSIRHLSTVHSRLGEARTTLELTFKYVEAFQTEAEGLLAQPFTERRMSNMLDVLLPNKPRTGTVKGTILENFVEGPTLDNVRGTKWAALNAVGEYYDHLRAPRTDQSKFMGSWTGVGMKTRQKALTLLNN